MDYAEKRLFQFFVSSRDSTELFELAEESLDFVALPVGLLVQPTRRCPVRFEWNHRFGTVISTRLPLRIAIEAFVTDNLFHVRDACRGLFQNRFQLRRLVRLTWHNIDRDGRVFVGSRQHDFAGEAAPTATKSLFSRRPLFLDAPAACRCARTLVASTSTRWTSSNAGSSVSNWNNFAKLPLAIQRRNRLYTASHAPNSPGKSRHGIPVRAQNNTASKNIRSESAGSAPHLYRLARSTHGSIVVQSSSVIMYRMASEPRGEVDIPFSTSTVYPETARIVNSA
jgi:hypothetical protein